MKAKKLSENQLICNSGNIFQCFFVMQTDYFMAMLKNTANVRVAT